MTIQDLTNNRDRIIRNIRQQITMASQQQIAGVMAKMIKMMDSAEKPTLGNVDKLTNRATASYIKYDIKFGETQGNLIDANYAAKQYASRPSSLK